MLTRVQKGRKKSIYFHPSKAHEDFRKVTQPNQTQKKLIHSIPNNTLTNTPINSSQFVLFLSLMIENYKLTPSNLQKRKKNAKKVKVRAKV